MEEKKLTDEEKAIEELNNYRNRFYAEPQGTERAIIANAINDVFCLIHRLQDENERLKSHMKAKEIADEHVRKMRGTDLRTIAELQKQVDELNKLSDGYFVKAYFYYQKCKAYGIENFYDDELEPKPAKGGKTITFQKFEHIEVE